MIDLDEFEDHYAGPALAWDDAADHPNFLAKIYTASKENTHHLKGVALYATDNRGDLLSQQTLHEVQARGLSIPTAADVDIDLKGDQLSVSWTTSIGTSGSGVAIATKTRGGLPSDLTPLAVKHWEGFKRKVNALGKKRYIFRGQENNQWRLRTSFHRTGRADLERYALNDVMDLQKTFSALLPYQFDLGKSLDYAAFLNLAQHHGYPTPMLDWTWSPYVAAFFALRNLKGLESSRRKVRIFKLDVVEWNKLPRATKLYFFPPNVSVINALSYGNSRAIPQQSISTVSNIDDIETHIQSIEKNIDKKYLEVIDIPVQDRRLIMNELALMGITAGSLFPGLDGACESLKERNF